MLDWTDWLKNHRLWRWFSELDTVSSLVTCLKIGAGVVNGLVASFGGWLDSQPASIKFVLFLSACLITISVINGVLWMLQWRVSHKKIKFAKTAVSPFPKGIDVQWLRPDIKTLAENWISIYLRVFNGSGFKVRVDLQTDGVMLFDSRHKVQPISLKTVTGNNDPITHGNSALFILVVTLHPDEARQLSNLLHNGKLACFSYDSFKIHITAIDHSSGTAQIRSDLPFTGTGFTISNGLIVEYMQESAGYA